MNNLLCILIPILIGLVCALLGYFLGKLLGCSNSKIRNLKEKITKLERALKACEGSKSKGVFLPFNSKVAKEVFGRNIKENDLKIIEGIGPKIEELFRKHNIKTWKVLSETSVQACEDILKSGGSYFVVHKPTTWPKQAKMAYEGRWKELLDWQEELIGGI